MSSQNKRSMEGSEWIECMKTATAGGEDAALGSNNRNREPKRRSLLLTEQPLTERNGSARARSRAIFRPGDETVNRDMMLSPKGIRSSANDKENIGVNPEWDTRVSEAEKVKLYVSERKEAFPEALMHRYSSSPVPVPVSVLRTPVEVGPERAQTTAPTTSDQLRRCVSLRSRPHSSRILNDGSLTSYTYNNKFKLSQNTPKATEASEGNACQKGQEEEMRASPSRRKGIDQGSSGRTSGFISSPSRLTETVSAPVPLLNKGIEPGRASSPMEMSGGDLSVRRAQSMFTRETDVEDFSLSKVSKTPKVMRVRRGTSFMFRMMDEEGGAGGGALHMDTLHVDENPSMHEDIDRDHILGSLGAAGGGPECMSGGPSPEPGSALSSFVSPQRTSGSASGWTSLSSSMRASFASPCLPLPELDEGDLDFHMSNAVTPVRSSFDIRRSIDQRDAMERGVGGGGVGGLCVLDDVDYSTPVMEQPNTVTKENGNWGKWSFTLMRSVSQLPPKKLHLVRHGESVYNHQLSYSKNWEDPTVFDPPLTHKGQKQCSILRGRLSSIQGLDSALWVCSPLSRAIDTMVYSCPFDIAEMTRRGQVIIRQETTEFLQTTGDIGLPASCLRNKYPMLAPGMVDLPEVWWYGNLETNNIFKERCSKFETKTSELERIEKFKQFIHSRPEEVIICIGHSLFWKHFSRSSDGLKNCDMMEMNL